MTVSVLNLRMANTMKKSYVSPRVIVVELKRQNDLLQCSSGGGVETTPGICGGIG